MRAVALWRLGTVVAKCLQQGSAWKVIDTPKRSEMPEQRSREQRSRGSTRQSYQKVQRFRLF